VQDAASERERGEIKVKRIVIAALVAAGLITGAGTAVADPDSWPGNSHKGSHGPGVLCHPISWRP
jgi:hypothetical protein